MSNNNSRGRLGGVDTQSGIVGGVHLEVEGTVGRLTVDGNTIHILVRRQYLYIGAHEYINIIYSISDCCMCTVSVGNFVLLSVCDWVSVSIFTFTFRSEKNTCDLKLQYNQLHTCKLQYNQLHTCKL